MPAEGRLHVFDDFAAVAARFPDRIIFRLPGLYGPGPRRNLVHDLLIGAPPQGFDDRVALQF